jgi:hypothetical protein
LILAFETIINCISASESGDHIRVQPLSLAMDDDGAIAHLLKTICDPSSASSVLYGVGVDDLRAMLDKHSICYEYNLSIDSC